MSGVCGCAVHPKEVELLISDRNLIKILFPVFLFQCKMALPRQEVLKGALERSRGWVEQDRHSQFPKCFFTNFWMLLAGLSGKLAEP